MQTTNLFMYIYIFLQTTNLFMYVFALPLVAHFCSKAQPGLSAGSQMQPFNVACWEWTSPLGLIPDANFPLHYKMGCGGGHSDMVF